MGTVIGFYNELGYEVCLWKDGYFKDELFSAGNFGFGYDCSRLKPDDPDALPLKVIEELCLIATESSANELGLTFNIQYEED